MKRKISDGRCHLTLASAWPGQIGVLWWGRPGSRLTRLTRLLAISPFRWELLEPSDPSSKDLDLIPHAGPDSLCLPPSCLCQCNGAEANSSCLQPMPSAEIEGA